MWKETTVSDRCVLVLREKKGGRKEKERKEEEEEEEASSSCFANGRGQAKGGGIKKKGKEVREVFGTEGEYSLPRYKEYCRLCTFFQDTVFPASNSPPFFFFFLPFFPSPLRRSFLPRRAHHLENTTPTSL